MSWSFGRTCLLAGLLLQPEALRAEKGAQIVARAVALVMGAYVDPQKLSPARLLEGAADELARVHDPLLVEGGGDGSVLTLRMGGDVLEIRVSTLALLPQQLGEVVDFVGRHLPPDAASPPELAASAIDGLLHALDPYSRSLYARRLESHQVTYRGTLGGIGARISRAGEHLVFRELYPSSPALRAGVRVGDRLVLVDGRPVAALSLEQAIDRIRGAPGTSVRLQLARDGRPAPVDLTVPREQIPHPHRSRPAAAGRHRLPEDRWVPRRSPSSPAARSPLHGTRVRRDYCSFFRAWLIVMASPFALFSS